MHITNRDINPSQVGAVHLCKAPLWFGRLDLNSLNLTPRFAHRLLLLLRLVISVYTRLDAGGNFAVLCQCAVVPVVAVARSRDGLHGTSGFVPVNVEVGQGAKGSDFPSTKR